MTVSKKQSTKESTYLPVMGDTSLVFGHHLRGKVHSDFLSFEVGKTRARMQEEVWGLQPLNP